MLLATATATSPPYQVRGRTQIDQSFRYRQPDQSFFATMPSRTLSIKELRKLREQWALYELGERGCWNFDELSLDQFGEWYFLPDTSIYSKAGWRGWLKKQESVYGQHLEERLKEVEKEEREAAKEIFEIRRAWNDMMCRRYDWPIRSYKADLLFRRCRSSDPIWHPTDGEEPEVTAERKKLIECIKQELHSDRVVSREGSEFVLLRIAKENIYFMKYLIG